MESLLLSRLLSRLLSLLLSLLLSHLRSFLLSLFDTPDPAVLMRNFGGVSVIWLPLTFTLLAVMVNQLFF